MFFDLSQTRRHQPDLRGCTCIEKGLVAVRMRVNRLPRPAQATRSLFHNPCASSLES